MTTVPVVGRAVRPGRAPSRGPSTGRGSAGRPGGHRGTGSRRRARRASGRSQTMRTLPASRPTVNRASCLGESSASPAARTEAPLIDTSMIRTGIVLSFTRPKRPCCLTKSSPTWSTGLRSPRRGTRPPGKLMDTAPIIPSAPSSDRIAHRVRLNPASSVEPMCGRFVSASPPDQIAAYFSATEVSEQALESNWNVGADSDVYVVVQDGGVRRLATRHWGSCRSGPRTPRSATG